MSYEKITARIDKFQNFKGFQKFQNHSILMTCEYFKVLGLFLDIEPLTLLDHKFRSIQNLKKRL